jgi:hypothetical protein
MTQPYTIHDDIVILLRHYLAEIYGVEMLIDVFANEATTLFPFFGLRSEVLDRCRQDGQATFILADWTKYDQIIPWLIALKLHCSVIIAPQWPQHGWYNELIGYCSHVWWLPA